MWLVLAASSLTPPRAWRLPPSTLRAGSAAVCEADGGGGGGEQNARSIPPPLPASTDPFVLLGLDHSSAGDIAAIKSAYHRLTKARLSSGPLFLHSPSAPLLHDTPKAKPSPLWAPGTPPRQPRHRLDARPAATADPRRLFAGQRGVRGGAAAAAPTAQRHIHVYASPAPSSPRSA